MRKLFSLFTFVLLVGFAQAQPGTLDFSFGNEGFATSVISEGFNMAKAIAVQPDGKIIAVGHTGTSGSYNVGVVRYNEDGSNDNTFGTDGMVIISATNTNDYALDITFQPDGKIVLGGYIYSSSGSTTDVLVIRLNADGTLDNTFGTAGIVITNLGTDEVAEDIVLQDDGKILLAGYHNDRFMVLRYTTNGTLDNTFGTGGKASANVGVSICFGQSLVIQNDGKIIVGGLGFNDASNYAFSMARFNTDGTLDNNFADNGTKIFNIGQGHDFMTAIALQSDGKIIAGGHTWVANQPTLQYDFAAARLNPDGSIDNTFGNQGITTVNLIYGGNYVSGMVVQDDDKIILSGNAEGQAEYDLGMVRLTADGVLDTSFGTEGITVPDVNNGADDASGVALQPDGKIVVAGHTLGADFPEFLVARFLNDVVSNPAVTITPLEITNTTVEASFTPNAACATYFILIGIQSEMEMWSAMMGVSVDSLVQMWGIEKSEAFTYLWTDQAPNTEYTLYARPLDANGFGYPLNTTTVTTLTGGGNGLAEIQVEVTQITDSSVRLIATPNDQTAVFFDGLITKEYFNEIGQDSAVAVIKDNGYPQYTTDDWVWLGLSAATDYYAIAVGKNALDEWGPATIVEFTTLEPVGISDPVEDQKTAFIFPMPNNGMFTFAAPEGQPGTIRIFNTNGQIVFDQSVSGDQPVIDARQLSNGMYHVHFTSESKAITITEKLIIAK